MLRAFSYWQRQTPAEHAEVRTALERAVEIDPGYSHAWACLAILYLDEIRVGFNPRPEPGRRMMEAAHRAVATGPTNHLAYLALAQARFFSGDVDAFFPAGERAVQLNPNDSTTLAMVGTLTAFAGDWERGMAMLHKAVALNPHHPGWYQLPLAMSRLRRGEHEGALDEALKINMPGYYPAHMVLTATYGHLGRERRGSGLRCRAPPRRTGLPGEWLPADCHMAMRPGGQGPARGRPSEGGGPTRGA